MWVITTPKTDDKGYQQKSEQLVDLCRVAPLPVLDTIKPTDYRSCLQVQELEFGVPSGIKAAVAQGDLDVKVGYRWAGKRYQLVHHFGDYFPVVDFHGGR